MTGTSTEPEVLREVWRITERRGGAVYKTEYVEDRWVGMTEARTTRPDGNPDLRYAVKGTDYKGQTIRRKKA